MTTPLRLRPAAGLPLLALLALAGCTPVDTRELRLELTPRDATEMTLEFTIASSAASAAELRLDGRLLGTYQRGRAYTLSLAAEREGLHRLEASVSGPRPPRPVHADVEVFRGGPRVTAMRPAAGAVAPVDPLTIELDLAEPIDPAAFQPGQVTVRSQRPATPETTRPAQASLQADGRTLRIVVPGGFQAFEELRVAGVITGYGGHQLNLGQALPFTAWWTPSARIAWLLRDPLAPVWASGVTSLQVGLSAFTGPEPTSAEVRVAGASVGTVDFTPVGTASLDATSMAEGDYAVTAVVAGHLVEHPPLTLRVDHTPPRVTCAPFRHADPVLERFECIQVFTTEFMPCGTAALLPAGERPLGCGIPLTVPGPNVACGGKGRFGSFTERLALSAEVTDLAGNTPVIEGCEYTVPAWTSPWGEGALAPGGAAITADAFAIAASNPSDEVIGRGLAVGWIPSAASPDAGRLRAARWSGTAWAQAETLSTPGAVASRPAASGGVRGGLAYNFEPHLAWVERTAGGPGQIRTASAAGAPFQPVRPGPLNVDPARDADEPAVGTSPLGEGRAVFAWTEADGAGGRAVQALLQADGAWRQVGGEARQAAGSAASAPSWSATHTGAPQITFLERAAGQPSRVRATFAAFEVSGDYSWSPTGGLLNADLAASAADPTSTGYTLVAWAEGGTVYARVAANQNLAFLEPPVALNADPAEAAREPQAYSGAFWGVAFVEETPLGDQIRLQVLDQDGWHLVDGAVNEGVAGPVRSLRVAGTTRGAVVAWLDADGHLRVRLANF